MLVKVESGVYPFLYNCKKKLQGFGKHDLPNSQPFKNNQSLPSEGWPIFTRVQLVLHQTIMLWRICHPLINLGMMRLFLLFNSSCWHLFTDSIRANSWVQKLGLSVGPLVMSLILSTANFPRQRHMHPRATDAFWVRRGCLVWATRTGCWHKHRARCKFWPSHLVAATAHFL